MANFVPTRPWPGPPHRTVAEPAILEGLRLQAGAAGPDVVQAALDRLVAAGLPFGRGADGGRTFDPGEVFNLAKTRALLGQDDFWVRHCVPAGRARTVAMPACPQRVALRWRRRVALVGATPGRRLRLRLPLPIEDGYLQHLTVAAAVEDAVPLQVARMPARLEVLLAAPDQPSVTVEARVDFTSVANGAPGNGPDQDMFLRHQDGFIQVTQGVADVARTLAGRSPTAGTAIPAFADFMLDRLACGVVPYAAFMPSQAVDWVLRHGWFDCHLGSALFASLCRAAGIPARLVGGLLLYPTAPTPHHWVEVLQDQEWRPVDLLAWDLSAGGRDPAWRTCFRGQVDHRMRTERLPLLFTGASSLPRPQPHHLLMTPTPDGAAVSHIAAQTGAVLYRDEIAVSLAPAG